MNKRRIKMKITMKNSNKYIVLAMAIIIIAAFVGPTILHSLVAPFIPIPTAIYGSTVYNSTNQLINPSTGYPIGSGLVMTSYQYGGVSGTNLYGLEYCGVMYNGNSNQQICDSFSGYLYVSNQPQGQWGYAASSDLSELAGINSTIAYDQSNANTACASGSNPSCSAWTTRVSNQRNLLAILQNAIAYENSLQPVGTTTVLGSTTINTATTSVSATTTVSCSTCVAPPPPILTQITTGLSGALNSFMLSLQSIWTQYFNVPSGLFTFSISATNVSTTNVTTVGSQVTGTVNLNIPQADVSTAWSPSVTYVVRTYCQAAYDYNTSVPIFENSTIVNMTSTSFTYTFPVKATEPGVIVFGGICETTNTTYSLSTGTWSAWTPFKNVTVEHYAIYVAGNQTLTTAVTPIGSGIIVPPTGTHPYGSQVTLGEQASTGYAFLKWQGTGKGNYTGTIVNPTVTMNNNITETAVFQVSTSAPPQNNNPPPLSAQWFSNLWNSFTSWLAGFGL